MEDGDGRFAFNRATGGFGKPFGQRRLPVADEAPERMLYIGLSCDFKKEAQ